MGGGNCLQYLKRGGTEEGRGHKDFKKGVFKLGQGVDLSASKSPHLLWYLCCLSKSSTSANYD